jgi:hypothetical protein
MCSVLLIRHYEAGQQPTGVPRLVTRGCKGKFSKQEQGRRSCAVQGWSCC